jgi:hypothetical protein
MSLGIDDFGANPKSQSALRRGLRGVIESPADRRRVAAPKKTNFGKGVPNGFEVHEDLA